MASRTPWGSAHDHKLSSFAQPPLLCERPRSHRPAAGDPFRGADRVTDLPAPVAPPADLSLVMPCYNEEEVVGYTIPGLVRAFGARGHRLELVAVDNGSTDRTGEIIQQLSREHPGVVLQRVEVNQGYGNGILSG